LRSETKSGIEQATEAKAIEDAKPQEVLWDTPEADRMSADTAQLLTQAEAASVTPATMLELGRKAALQLIGSGGTWTAGAAEGALTGNEADMRKWLTEGRAAAAEQDDRFRVIQMIDTSASMELRMAALNVLDGGTHSEVVQFLRLLMYEGKQQADRIAIAKIMSAGGLATKLAAQNALNGTVADAHAFLRTGQYIATEQDDRIAIAQAMEAGGAEVDAAARVALAGPRSYLRSFLESGLYKAKQRDNDTALHVATVQRFVAETDTSAALARQNAAEAARVAAVARQAAAEAAKWAEQARQSAAQAAAYAEQAKQAAAAAKSSAEQAAASATAARNAAKEAPASDRAAGSSAVRATAAAVQAKAYAAQAYASSARARAAAAQAGLDAAAAAEAALEAFNVATQKALAEQKAARQNPTEPAPFWRRDQPPQQVTRNEDRIGATIRLWDLWADPRVSMAQSRQPRRSSPPPPIGPGATASSLGLTSLSSTPTAAGLDDPTFLLALLIWEITGERQGVQPIDNLVQFGSVKLDNAGIWGWLKSNIFPGKGNDPPSIGWTNLQEEAFNETVRNHPDAFQGVEWTDLIGNHDLAIKAAAYHLKDLEDYAKQVANAEVRNTYTPQEVAAAMYNVGKKGYWEGVMDSGNLGPTASNYVLAVQHNELFAHDVICESGIWTCKN
jgi:hypothetical protein